MPIPDFLLSSFVLGSGRKELLAVSSLSDGDLLQVKSIGGFSKSADFAEKPGSPLTWRQNRELSGLNIGTLGIFYECLQR